MRKNKNKFKFGLYIGDKDFIDKFLEFQSIKKNYNELTLLYSNDKEKLNDLLNIKSDIDNRETRVEKYMNKFLKDLGVNKTCSSIEGYSYKAPNDLFVTIEI